MTQRHAPDFTICLDDLPHRASAIYVIQGDALGSLLASFPNDDAGMQVAEEYVAELRSVS